MSSAPSHPTDPERPGPVRRTLAVWLATGLGVGLWSPAPGTAGALWGLPLAWAIGQLPGIAWQVVAVVLLCAVGVPLTTAAGRDLGGQKDNQAVVWDELASLPIVFLFVPLSNWTVGMLGFALHRLFDITKPPPVRQVERLPDGLGVMADDWIAAGYAGITLTLLVWLDQWTGWHILAANGG